MYGVPPAAACNLQAAIVQGTMPCAFELPGNGGTGVEGEYQRVINRIEIGWAALGCFRSTPMEIVAAESSSTPARALLVHWQARYTQHLYARPQHGDGPEEILMRERAAATTRLRATAALPPGETVEGQECGVRQRFPGRIEGQGPPDRT